MAFSIGTPNLQAQCKIPLVIGIVGHRCYPKSAEPFLRSAIERVFLRLREHHAPDTPFLVLSSLAQGADQLAVEVALEMRALGKINASFVAPLPFPRDQFARSTSFDASPEGQLAAARMIHWINDGTVTSYLTCHPDCALSESERWPIRSKTKEAKALRDKCYAYCGAYLVRRSHVLIALWDEEGLTLGGRIQSETEKFVADLVRYQIEGTLPHLLRHERPDLGDEGPGPAYIVYTPRVDPHHPRTGDIRVLVGHGDATPVADPESRCSDIARFAARIRRSLGGGVRRDDTSPEEAANLVEDDWNQFLTTCHTLAGYNRDVERMWGRVERKGIATAVRDFLYAQEPDAPEKPKPWPNPRANTAFERLVCIRTAASALSEGLQTALEWLQLAMFISIGLAAVAFDSYDHISGGGSAEPFHNPFWLIGYFIVTLLPMVIVGWVWLARIDEKRLDYRALAEALRVRCWWAFAGISESVADSYLSQLHTEVAWQRNSLLGISPPPRLWKQFFEELPDESARMACIERVREKWIKGQISFYERNFHKHHKYGSTTRCVAVAAAVAAIGIAFFVLCFFPLHPPEYAISFSALLLVVGGLFLAYGERQSHEELARQYDRMYAVFKRADEKLEQILPSDPKYFEHVATVLRLIGREAILEHAQWVVLRRSRAFEVPFH